MASFFGGGSSKTTLPWESQYGGWGTLSQFDPIYAQGFHAAKPNMYKQVFGRQSPEEVGTSYPASQFTKSYDPWAATGPNSFYGRPGGATPQEQGLINNSYFGMVSPFQMGGPQGANQAYQQNLAGIPGGQIENLGQQALGAIGPGMDPQRMGYIQGAAGAFNAAPYGMGALQGLVGGTPGLATGMMNAVTPGQLFANVNAQGPALQGYVNQATGGMRAGFQQELAKQLIDLQSRFAGEGSYLSSPMFSAMGELTSGLTGQYLRDIGQMQLGAAEAERGRQYTGAQQQAQNALQAFGTYGPLAGQFTGQQGGFLGGIYGQGAGLFENTANARASVVNNAMNLMQQGAATNFQQAFQMAQEQQQNEQQALSALQQQFYQPGQNLLNLYQAINQIPQVSKTEAPGLGRAAWENLSKAIMYGSGGGGG